MFIARPPEKFNIFDHPLAWGMIQEYKNMTGLNIQSSNVQPLFENKILPMWASTKVAAAILGITPNALRIRKCRGEVECRYFGKQLRFNVNYLQSLFREEKKLRKE